MTTPPAEDQEPAPEQQETPNDPGPRLTRAQVTEALLKVIQPDPKP